MEADPASEDHHVSAETPLLPPSPRTSSRNGEEQEPTTNPTHPHLVRAVAIVIVCIFLLEVGDYMMRAPIMRILEDIVCRKYYASHPRSGTPRITLLAIPEDECKIAPVQAEMAMVWGWDEALSCLPAVFLAVPYGYVGDRYGRKPMFILALFGVTLLLIWQVMVGMFCLVLWRKGS